jgi:hypothetical protein
MLMLDAGCIAIESLSNELSKAYNVFTQDMTFLKYAMGDFPETMQKQPSP